jgi:hypothetical protein
MRINHRAQACKANTRVQLRTIHQSKESFKRAHERNDSIRWIAKEHKVCLEEKGLVNFEEMVAED